MSTKIEWTEETWNPVVGCSPVSAGCERCYAARLAHRGLTLAHRGLTHMTGHGPKWTGEVRCPLERLEQPLRWRKPRRIFVCSMSDLFHPDVPDEFIDKVFATMALCPQHTFQVLTKRPERMRSYFEHVEPQDGVNDTRYAHVLYSSACWLLGHGKKPSGRPPPWPLPSVWLGVTAENQKTTPRIDVLRQTPAAVRFLSCEPLLEDLGELDLTGIDWVIVGGESGPGARPCSPLWIYRISQMCRSAGVALFVKQFGSNLDRTLWDSIKHRSGADPSEWPEDLRVRDYPR